MTQLLELPSTQGFDIEIPELGLIETPNNVMSPEEIYNTAVENRPEIKSAETMVESSKRTLGIARGTYYPSLSLSGSWGSGYSGANKIGTDPFTQQMPIGYTEISHETVIAERTGYESYNPKAFGDQLRENRNNTVSLNLRIPIFNGWSSRSSVAQAKIGMENANLDYPLLHHKEWVHINNNFNFLLVKF